MMWLMIKQTANDMISFISKLINSQDPTSMTRFLAFWVCIDISFTWTFMCFLYLRMVEMPTNVMYFGVSVIAGKAIKDIFCKE